MISSWPPALSRVLDGICAHMPISRRSPVRRGIIGAVELSVRLFAPLFGRAMTEAWRCCRLHITPNLLAKGFGTGAGMRQPPPILSLSCSISGLSDPLSFHVTQSFGDFIKLPTIPCPCKDWTSRKGARQPPRSLSPYGKRQTRPRKQLCYL